MGLTGWIEAIGSKGEAAIRHLQRRFKYHPDTGFHPSVPEEIQTTRLAKYARNMDRIADAEYRMHIARELAFQKRQFAHIADALKRAGYDAVEYINQAEDIGSTSVAVLDPAQIFAPAVFHPKIPVPRVMPLARKLAAYNLTKPLRDQEDEPLLIQD